MGYRLMKTPAYCHYKKGRRPGVGYWYYCRKGYPLTRLPGLPFAPEFMAAYDAVHNGKRITIGKAPEKGTMAALIVSYLTSPQWKALEPSTQRTLLKLGQLLRRSTSSRLLGIRDKALFGQSRVIE